MVANVTSLFDDNNNVWIGKGLNHIAEDDVTQRIRIPVTSTHNGLLPATSWVTRRLRPHSHRNEIMIPYSFFTRRPVYY
jgi:hypothetical protein